MESLKYTKLTHLLILTHFLIFLLYHSFPILLFLSSILRKGNTQATLQLNGQLFILLNPLRTCQVNLILTKSLIDLDLLSYTCRLSRNVCECFPQSLVTTTLENNRLNKDKSYLAREQLLFENMQHHLCKCALSGLEAIFGE